MYVAYLALGRHFTTDSYDYHKYNGKVRVNAEKFATRNDTFFFYKLSKDPDWFELMLSNMVKDPKVWVRSLLGEEAREVFLDRKKRLDSLKRTFEVELNELDDDFESNFVVPKGGLPKLISLHSQKRVSLETLCIICSITGVMEYWKEALTDKTIGKDILRKISKYTPFLDFDKKKYSDIVKYQFSMNK